MSKKPQQKKFPSKPLRELLRNRPKLDAIDLPLSPREIEVHKWVEELEKTVEDLITGLQKRKDGYIKLIATCAENVKEIKNLEIPEMLDKAEEYLQIISKFNARLSEIKWVLVLLGMESKKEKQGIDIEEFEEI